MIGAITQNDRPGYSVLIGGFIQPKAGWARPRSIRSPGRFLCEVAQVTRVDNVSSVLIPNRQVFLVLSCSFQFPPDFRQGDIIPHVNCGLSIVLAT